MYNSIILYIYVDFLYINKKLILYININKKLIHIII